MAQCSGRQLQPHQHHRHHQQYHHHHHHITQMQLFHELKQKFPNLPDRLVNHCIKQTRGDKAACACILEAETVVSSQRMAGRSHHHHHNHQELKVAELETRLEAASTISPPHPGGLSHSAPSTPSSARRPPAPPALTPPPHQPKPRPPASRTTSLPQVKRMTRATMLLIQNQLAVKKELEMKVEEDRQKLRDMQATVRELEEDLKMKTDPYYRSIRVQQLTEEVRKLGLECQRLTQEVSSRNDGVPLGETNEEYYRRRGVHNRDREIHNPSAHSVAHRSSGSSGARSDHHRLPHHQHRTEEHEDSPEGAMWTCTMCTFENNPLLKSCEYCSMPRFDRDGGETQNIHIHVTHHNFPSCKVVHSWVI